MPYELVLINDFATWLDEQDEERRIKVLGHLDLLEERGPLLGRPYVDTLKGSKIANLKELRVQHKSEPIRILFAFDPKQQAVIILGGSKQGDKRWYDTNIPLAETLFSEYLEKQRKADRAAASKEKKND
ncbi:MAG: type II toxin-antitoxin system RelE/ParE family toxin [Candidatus Obscuribacterales bacterium]|nr:type II toxin-antitoxin system RelE/ParE family toxin [Candidatus Obscuribacterales bacterium]